jgi:hypothetical protein
MHILAYVYGLAYYAVLSLSLSPRGTTATLITSTVACSTSLHRPCILAPALQILRLNTFHPTLQDLKAIPFTFRRMLGPLESPSLLLTSDAFAALVR